MDAPATSGLSWADKRVAGRCRAKGVVEAGWAAFKLERLDTASGYLARGAKLTRSPRSRGACLYNLGRVHERMGNKGDAAAAYKRSLVLRPNNAETKRRYNKLSAYDAVSCPPSESLKDIEAACAKLRELDSDPRIGCSAKPIEDVEGSGPGKLLIVEDQFTHSGAWMDRYLVRQDADGVHFLVKIGSSWSRGCSQGNHRVDAAAYRQVIPAGPEELVVDIDVGEDYTCHMMVDEDAEPFKLDETRRVVCGMDDDRWRCSGVIEGSVPRGPAVRDMLQCPRQADGDRSSPRE